jgi:hypothetical protein
MITFDFISIFPLSHGNTRPQFNQSLLDQTRGVNEDLKPVDENRDS